MNTRWSEALASITRLSQRSVFHMAANWNNEHGSLRTFSVFWNTHCGNVEFVCLAPVVVAEQDDLKD